MAEERGRKLSGSHPVALVRAGAKSENGELVEASEEKDAARHPETPAIRE